jgi:APA family basic amino acid/polyamine antiporter
LIEPPAGQLPRRLSLVSAVAIIIGVTIGSGIFRVPSEVAAQAGSAGAMLAVWVAGGILMFCFALLLAELGAMYPEAGGLYVFVREAWGPLPAFLFGWSYLLIIPAGWGAIAVVFAEYLGRYIPLTEPGRRGVAIGLVLLLAAANYRSVMIGASIQNALTFFKVVGLLALTLAILSLGNPAGGSFTEAAVATPVTTAGFLLALVAVLWAYDGPAAFCSMIGEVRDPQRNVPRALFIGVGAVMLLYLAVNVAYLHILPIEVIAHSPLVAAEAARRVLGAGASALISALVMTSTLGAVAASSMSDPRVFFALARDGNFFASTGRIHPRFRTPHVAIVVATAIACAYLAIRTFEQLAATYVLGLLPFYVLAAAGVARLRRDRPDAVRPFRCPGHRLLLALYVGAAAIMLGTALVHSPRITAINLAISAAGIPVYYAWKRLSRGPTAA